MHKWMTKTKGTSCERGYATFLHLSLTALRLRMRVPNVSSRTRRGSFVVRARMQIKRKQIKGFVVHGGGGGFCVRFFAHHSPLDELQSRSSVPPFETETSIAADIEPTLSQRLNLVSTLLDSFVERTWLLFVPVRRWLAISETIMSMTRRNIFVLKPVCYV